MVYNGKQNETGVDSLLILLLKHTSRVCKYGKLDTIFVKWESGGLTYISAKDMYSSTELNWDGTNGESMFVVLTLI